MTSREAFEAWFRGYYVEHGFISSKDEALCIWQAATDRAAKIADKDHYGEWLAAAIRAR